MAVSDATECVRTWVARPNVRLIYPGPRHCEIVFALLETAGTGGNLVSDAPIAALAQEHGATVHSADTDFARFRDLAWRNPLLPAR